MSIPNDAAPPPLDSGDCDGFITQLLAWMRQAGMSRYDEQVTQIEHALQTAAIVAQTGGPPHLVAAALLHDVGHLLAHEHAGDGNFLAADLQHEEIGAAWLGGFFPKGVVNAVRLHVPAKRYLCAIDPAYRQSLSPAS
ncbi:MAG TPA: HD domain-containing protein, partial [Stellaceae bacterium]|nr:HD domain-containing protein [Stellaceae bacterium]